MRTVGIICECNPPHAGHFYLIDEARRAGDARVICVMSGCFVQRAEAAILDPFARAELLVRAGADAVVELPFPYSSASAEFFGRAGVEILSALGADELWFGSERGELSSLTRLARAAESEAFVAAYRESAAGNAGTAQAYFDLLARYAGEATPPSPNDILAISYLRAIARSGSAMHPVTVRRRGSGYAERTLTGEGFPSATALRRAWLEKDAEAVLAFVPERVREVILREEAEGRAPACLENAAALLVGSLRLADPQRLSSFAGLSGGVGERLVHAAREANDLSSLFSLAATKKYPDATLRRALLSALFEVRAEDLSAPVSYVRLLAASREGCALLGQRRRAGGLTVVTRRGEIPESAAAQRQRMLEERACDLYTLTLPRPASAHGLLCRPPVILDGTP